MAMLGEGEKVAVVVAIFQVDDTAQQTAHYGVVGGEEVRLGLSGSGFATQTCASRKSMHPAAAVVWLTRRSKVETCGCEGLETGERHTTTVPVMTVNAIHIIMSQS
eukprot:1232774-Amphidinium_carterae.1